MTDRKTIYALLAILLMISCSTQRKLAEIKEGKTVSLALSDETASPQELKYEEFSRDTLTVTDDRGNEILIMKAVRDETTGEMVATDVLDAAKVTARFRNVAERHGKVDLAFQVIVPEEMMDSKWQLRFCPDLFILGDSLRLSPVVITGAGYRKAQLRGYQQYEKFLSKIISDTTRFINIRQLEIFLRRNIPELYAFKTDTSYVSDEEFRTVYGLTQQEAVEHYTNHYAKNRNNGRIARKDEMFRKYVKAPLVTEGIRLDTVIVSPDGNFIYNYVQTINTRPKLRKADIVLSGEIYEQDKKIYTIPPSQPLTFYISSISSLVDGKERYITTVIERQVVANAECRIDFEEGRSEIIPGLNDNLAEIRKIQKTLEMLAENVEFDLDSITVSATASPEGSLAANRALAMRRSAAVSEHFNASLRHFRDSLAKSAGIRMDIDGNLVNDAAPKEISFTPRCIPENWEDLFVLVGKDTVLNETQKADFFRTCTEENLDAREKALQEKTYYSYLKKTFYPKLRTVKFNFCLHRKGMVKDTVHTTVPDTLYRDGVQAIRDMDYLRAIEILRPYDDFNTAVAYIGLDRNSNALRILEKLDRTAQVNYLLAVAYSRVGRHETAVQCYMDACRQNSSYVHRGNLDPEISALIKLYGLNALPGNGLAEEL